MVAELGSWRGRSLTPEEREVLRNCPCPACVLNGLEGLAAGRMEGFCNRATHNLWVLLEEARWVEDRLSSGNHREYYKDRLDTPSTSPLSRRRSRSRRAPSARPFEGGGYANCGAERSENARKIVKRSERAVAVVSGGMDSVTLAYMLDSEGYDLHIISVDYGQRHRKEISYAERCANRLEAVFNVADISGIGRLLSGSALTDGVEVPHGRYAAENMAVTVVPNRNAIMLSIAYGVAVAQNALLVACAVHTGDHFVYPDCRPRFVDSFDRMQREAVEGFGNPGLHLRAPFLDKSKAQIIEIGAALDVPYEETWTCYEGCVFQQAGVLREVATQRSMAWFQDGTWTHHSRCGENGQGGATRLCC